MNLVKSLSTLSLAFTLQAGALVGAATLLAPSQAEANNKGHISYEALKRNNIPQGQRGGHQNNGRPGAEANKYNRGCNKITKCRG